MKGLEISVTNSDLVIKQEEKNVKLFVIFKDKKYGTKYIIFTDNIKKELYYGSPLVNNNKMIIMKFKTTKDEELIKEFVWDFLNNKESIKYELIEIPKIDKLEIIDNNTLEVKEEYINILEDIFFKKEEIIIENQENNIIKKKSKGPIIFILIIFIILITGFIYIKNNPELIYGKEIYVECTIKYDIKEIDSTVTETVNLTFSNSEKLKKHNKDITYSFLDSDKYYEFKEKDLKYKYVNESGLDKFVDEELSYKLFIEYNINKNYELPKTYNELYDYYKNNSYSCKNIEQ